MLERRAQLETIFREVEKQTQRNGKPAQGRILEFTKRDFFVPFQSLIVKIYHHQLNLITALP